MKDMSIAEFAGATASGNPVPGGGSVAALCGGLAAALVEMVANLTEDNEMMTEIRSRMSIARENLLDLIEKDSRAFTEVMEAYRLPKTNPDEKKFRTKAIEDSLVNAAKIPMETAEQALDIMQFSREVVENGNQNAVTDGMVSAMMARTAVLASLLNVRTNLSSIRDRDFAEVMLRKAVEMEEACSLAEKQILASVKI